ncbi:glucose-1-phosphatase-like [Melitaea cinxia]|uniref:glucose-1-phosphatase-like n=1 Tax=Melitaea cinxia TaxID=113334 RepID=UPI001E270598|nr:glucose-1-phosphatase-like [Melitaea cinxia]
MFAKMAGKFDVYIFLNLISIVIGHELTQVIMLSRHNIRTPLTSNLERFSPNVWPTWDQQAGYLTAKGTKLEEYMGEYLSKWLKKENLLNENCPDDNSVYIYANGVQRTRNSAKAFAHGAFRLCNVTIHSIKSYEMDPTFNPILKNNSKELKNAIIKEMKKKLNKLELNQSYRDLEEIIDLENSEICKQDNLCSFVNTKDNIYYEIGEEPNIIGPLAYGNAIIDSFIMGYYEGMALEKVAWGKITTAEKWKSLTKITKENQNIRFNNTIIAKEVAEPLINYIKELFESKKAPKFTLLHGHDSNLNSVMAAFRFKYYVLPDQYEYIPIGGKLVFQKWRDTERNIDLLKVNYVYQTVKQLREGIKATEEFPRWYEMEISGCPIDENGFCLWDDFMKILKQF